MSTIIVGALLVVLLTWSFKRTKRDLKNSKCGGCSGCGLKSQCSSSSEIETIQLKL